MVRQDLDGVGDDEGRVGDVVGTIVQEDERNDGIGSALVASDGVSSRGDGLAREEDEHADVGREEERAATSLVADKSTDDRDNEVVDLKSEEIGESKEPQRRWETVRRT